MKRMKKYASLLLALVMALALAVPAMAADDTYTITIKTDKTGHTYEAYQIFSGVLSEDGKTLSDIEWGTGVDDAIKTLFPDAAAKAASLNNDNVADFAELVAGHLTTVAGTSVAKADGTGYEIIDLAPGYYLVKDLDGSLEGSDTEVYTPYILHIVTDVTVTPKAEGTPTVDKTVDDVNDTTGEEGTGKTADHDIGDHVPFTLTATLPNMDKYETYKLNFVDTMSAGLTYDGNAKVYLGETEITDYFTVTPDEAGGQTLTLSCADVKKIPGVTEGSVITVKYTAQLNDDAVIGGTGNTNEVYLEFSNDPNHSGEGDEPEGKTPPKKVVVFTFKTVVNKVDPDGNPLDGAGFTLFKLVDGEWDQIGEEITDVTTFSFEGLDDGRYMLKETTVPDGYNSIDPIYFTIEAVHVLNDDGETGEIKELKVYATDEEGKKLTEEEKSIFEVDVPGGSAETDVENNRGVELPETGGIGTTIFYVLGGLLTLGAVVLLVTKKRMSLEEK